MIEEAIATTIYLYVTLNYVYYSKYLNQIIHVNYGIGVNQSYLTCYSHGFKEKTRHMTQ